MMTTRLGPPAGWRRYALVVLVTALVVAPVTAGASHQFSDVPDSHPFHDEISWLADHGITTGFPDGTYRPSNPVTRQAMAAFLKRLAEAGVVDAATLDGMDSTRYAQTCSGNAIGAYAVIYGADADPTFTTAGIWSRFSRYTCTGTEMLVRRVSAGIFDVLIQDDDPTDDRIGQGLGVASVTASHGGWTANTWGTAAQVASDPPPYEIAYRVELRNSSGTLADGVFAFIVTGWTYQP